MTLRVLVVDDEAIARRRLVRLLTMIPDVEIAGECSRGDDALVRTDVDVVLLDVEMPGRSGLDILRASNGPAVVLCTAHEQHALAAFDGGAVDYLLKPVDQARLAVALDRARARRVPPRDRLVVDNAKGVVLVDPAEVSHVTMDGELVVIHARTRHFSTSSLGELHEKLPRLVRVHRRALVSLDHVDRFDPASSGGLVARMRDGSLVDVSRQAARWLRKQWRS